MAAARAVPTISELGADWVEAQPLRDTPTVSNFWGAVGLRHDMVSLDAMVFTPYNGNMLRSNISVDGRPLALNATKWGACEATRRTDVNDSSSPAFVTSSIRLPFEQRAAIQRWSIVLPPSPPPGSQQQEQQRGQRGQHVVELQLDGPLFEHCDSCGWGVELPTNRSLFDFAVKDWQAGEGSLMTVTSHSSQTTVAATVWSVGPHGKKRPRAAQLGPDSTFTVQSRFSTSVTLFMAFAVAGTSDDAVTQLTRIVENSEHEWQGACSRWQQRWQQAFTPENEHYSGHLPVLQTDDAGLDRVYYFGALMLIALERTNLRLYPRVFTISQGNPSSITGSGDMGGSGQFTWDLTFTANVLSLLDPDATKEVLRYIIASSDLALPLPGFPHPWLVPPPQYKR
jgi:hypothetical protein